MTLHRTKYDCTLVKGYRNARMLLETSNVNFLRPTSSFVEHTSNLFLVHEILSQFEWLVKLCQEDKAIDEIVKKFFSNGNYYSPNPNQFHCCISCIVPAGCSVSFFSIPLFLLGGTQEERPAGNVKHNVLTHKKMKKIMLRYRFLLFSILHLGERELLNGGFYCVTI